MKNSKAPKKLVLTDANLRTLTDIELKNAVGGRKAGGDQIPIGT
jgi:hypothetical protein